jgi:transposase InsO family protein
MAWKELCNVGVREEFVLKALEPDGSFAGLCSEYGVSRKTGYKWLQRYKKGGVAALESLSRRPKQSPLRVSADVVAEVVRLRKSIPSLGAKKIAALLSKSLKDEAPNVRTVARILVRTGMQQPMRHRKTWAKVTALRPCPLVKAPNDLWTVDFKGWWLSARRERCEPLTVRDAFSRFVLGISVMAGTEVGPVKLAFEELFRKFGLPKSIQSDNGPPFAAPQSWHGLSSLSVWWLSLGIEVFRSRPGKPQDNGGHERMHRDMAEQLEAFSAYSRAAQQKKCDHWRHFFNHHRPHEALEMKFPGEVYRRSSVEYVAEPDAIEYPEAFQVRLASSSGAIKMHDRRVFLSTTLAGRYVGLERVDARRLYAVWFARHRIGQIDFTADRPELSQLRKTA